MKKSFKIVLVIFLSLGLVFTLNNSNTVSAASKFSDVDADHEFYNFIMYLEQEGITKGYTEGPKAGSFGINEVLSRRHAAMFLTRALGYKDEDLTYKGAFGDVSAGESGAGNIQKAYDLGLIDGYSNSEGSRDFRPNASLKRSQFSKMTALAYNLKPDDTKKVSLSDIEKSTEFTYIKALLDHSVVSGNSKENKFFPNNPVTRGQVSKFIYNAEQLELEPYVVLVSLSGLPGGRVIVDGYEYQMTFGDIASGNLANEIAKNMRKELLKKGITVKAIDSTTLEFTKASGKIFDAKYSLATSTVTPYVKEVSIKGPERGKVVVDGYEYQITDFDKEAGNVADVVAQNMRADLLLKDITVRAKDSDTLEFTRENGKEFEAKYIINNIEPFVVRLSLIDIPGGKVVVDGYEYQPSLADYLSGNLAQAIATRMRGPLNKKDITITVVDALTLEFMRLDGVEFKAEFVRPI